MSIDTGTLDRLRAIVGPHGYLDRPSDVEPFLIDHRKLYHGATALVLRPESPEQVAAIMQLCNEARIGVTIQEDFLAVDSTPCTNAGVMFSCNG